MSEETFEEWAILELMGHRRLAGIVREQTIGSSSFIRIDVPGHGESVKATQFYNPNAIYCITPTTEAIARRIAENESPQPVQRWELEDQKPQYPAPAGFAFEGRTILDLRRVVRQSLGNEQTPRERQVRQYLSQSEVPGIRGRAYLATAGTKNTKKAY